MTLQPTMPRYGVPRAPISDRDRQKLKRRLADLPACAARRGVTLDAFELHRETVFGDLYFEVGAWGYWATRRGSKLTLGDRARVVFAMLAAGLECVSYDFYTAFEFGERQLDSFFEVGDSAELVQAVSDLVVASQHKSALLLLQKLEWERPARQFPLFDLAG